jgi:VanZ family protein
MKTRLRTAARIVFILYVMAVAWLCFGKFDSLPDVPRSLWDIPMDKVVHFLMFLPFPVLAFPAFVPSAESRLRTFAWTLGVFISGCLFAAATELVQARLLPFRTGDPADFTADLIALGVGSLLVFVIDIWKKRK